MSDGPRQIKVRFDGKEITIVNPEAQRFRKGGKAIIWIRDPLESEWTFSKLVPGKPIPNVDPNPIRDVQTFKHRITAANHNQGGEKHIIPYMICVKSVAGHEVCAGSILPEPSFEPPFQIENEPNGGLPDPDDRPPKGRPRH